MENYIILITHPHIQKFLFLSFAGFIIRQSLVLSGQRWANTYHHLGSFIILPCISLVITSIIKDDIALSLGMIGALSIVRFRNPVKSPFELVMFFALITLGIVNSVSFILSFLFFLFITLIIFSIKLLEILLKKFNLNIYQYSFGDGNLSYTLEIISKKEIEELSKRKELLHFYFDKNEKNYSYRLVFQSREKLLTFKDSISLNPEIESIRVDMQA